MRDLIASQKSELPTAPQAGQKSEVINDNKKIYYLLLITYYLKIESLINLRQY